MLYVTLSVNVIVYKVFREEFLWKDELKCHRDHAGESWVIVIQDSSSKYIMLSCNGCPCNLFIGCVICNL